MQSFLIHLFVLEFHAKFEHQESSVMVKNQYISFCTQKNVQFSILDKISIEAEMWKKNVFSKNHH